MALPKHKTNIDDRLDKAVDIAETTQEIKITNQKNSQTFKTGNLYLIELKKIKTDPNQPRRNFDKKNLKNLSDSIKKNGVLQPVLVRIEQDQTIRVVAGERRYRASKIAKKKEIPVIITEGDPTEIALIENIQREDLKPIEEAEALDLMMQKFRYTQVQLAETLGKPRTTITEILSLNKLPEKIKTECRTSDIPKSIFIQLAKIKNKDEQLKLWENIKNKKTTVRILKNKKQKKKSNQTETEKFVAEGQRFARTIKNYAKEKILSEKEKTHLTGLRDTIDIILKEKIS